MPTNIYGPGDNFHSTSSHVLPALIRKVVQAKLTGARNLEVWGTGTPRREFLYSDDLAEACVFLMNLPEDKFAGLLSADIPPLINVWTGGDVTIRELAATVSNALVFHSTLVCA